MEPTVPLPTLFRIILTVPLLGIATALLGLAFTLPHVTTDDGVIAIDMTFVAVVLTACIPVGAALCALAMLG
jgi:hypothetical protein